jgi:Na+/H+-dicarboxylate symporter
MQNERGFFGSLFDLSFTSLVTTRIIKVLYVLAIIVIGLYALFFITAGFHRSSTDGVLVLVIAAPIFTLISLIYTRVLLEVFIALFRIMENTGELVTLAGGGESSAASPGGPQTPSSGGL